MLRSKFSNFRNISGYLSQWNNNPLCCLILSELGTCLEFKVSDIDKVYRRKQDFSDKSWGSSFFRQTRILER